MSSGSTLDLMLSLSRQPDRAAGMKALASGLGVENALLFVRDPVLDTWLPAPGMPQTVRGGPAWRAFLTGCASDGRFNGEVEQPCGTWRRACAVVQGPAVLVLLGGAPPDTVVREIERGLPMVSALLAAEQDALLARAEAASAREAASRAETLAGALEHARSDAARLNEQLREEHRRKDEFLAMLGHELRNPLAPLMNSIEVFRRGDAGKEVTDRLHEVMARQVVHLTRLVDDLLDASRVSRGRIKLQRETLMLPDVLRDAVETTRGLIAQRGHRLTLRGLEQGLAVSGDRVRLLQVFENLLNNAAKYTDPGGEITLEMTREGPDVCVRLTDTGIGISPEILPSVFDLFMQAPAGAGHAQGGLGIGLTLARMLTELHGGRVTVDSSGAGRGSTFSVTLPLVSIPQVVAQHAAQRKTGAGNVAPIHVIVVDDNRDAADSLSLLLREMGHTAEVAYTPAAALELSGRVHADLFLLDIGLPGMDGYELARQLRASAKSEARFVALTGFGTPNGARRSVESGFNSHLVKPVSLESLRRVVGEVGGVAA